MSDQVVLYFSFNLIHSSVAAMFLRGNLEPLLPQSSPATSTQISPSSGSVHPTIHAPSHRSTTMTTTEPSRRLCCPPHLHQCRFISLSANFSRHLQKTTLSSAGHRQRQSTAQKAPLSRAVRIPISSAPSRSIGLCLAVHCPAPSGSNASTIVAPFRKIPSSRRRYQSRQSC